MIDIRDFFKKNWVKKVLLSLHVSVIALILFVALVLNLLRIYLPGAFNNERLYFEQWASKALHLSVKIQDINVRWYHFSPMIEFSQVKIVGKNKEPKALIQRLAIEVSLFDSLMQWSLVPGTVLLDGAQLELAQDENNQLQFGKIDYSDGQNLLRQSLDFNETVTWLLTQGTVIIKNLDLRWKRPDGTYLAIKKINLQVMDKGFDRAIGGSADLPDGLGEHFAFGILLKNLDIKQLKFDADIYLGINKMKLQSWVKLPAIAGYLKSYAPTQGEGDLQAWIKWRKMQLKLVQARINFSKLVINNPANSNKWIVSDLSASLAWKKTKDGWALTGDHLRIHLNDKEWLENAFGFQQHNSSANQPAHQSIALKNIRFYDCQFVMDALKEMPESIKTLYLKLKPQGTLNHIVIEHSGDVWDADSIKLNIDFSALRTEAFDQWPGVSNFSGHVYWSAQHAQLVVNSHNFMLRWPKFFARALSMKTVQMGVDWFSTGNDWTINANSFHLDDENILLQGQAAFTHSAFLGNQLSINSKFKVDDLTKVISFLPKPVMDPDLYHWLSTALKAGAFSSGSFVFEGDPTDFPFNEHQGHFEVLANMSDIDLQFDPEWPIIENMSGHLVFDNAQMHVDEATAIMMKNPINHLNAAIPNLAEGVLSVWGHVDSNLEFAEDFLLKTPLTIGKKIESLSLQGPMTLDLKLKLPLNAFARAHTESETLGNLNVENAKVMVAALGGGLTDLKGALSFTGDSLMAPQLTAELFDQAVNISIDTLPGQNADLTRVAVNFSGQLDIDQVQKIVNNPWLKFVHGASAYQAQLILNPPGSANPDLFTLDTNLQGISISIDSLYEKKAEQVEALKLKVSLAVKDKLTELDVNYGSSLSAALGFSKLKEALHFVSGQVALGDQLAKLPTKPGLALLLSVPIFDWEEWHKLIEKYSKLLPADSSSNSDLLSLIQLKTANLIAFGHTLKKVDLKIMPSTAQWDVNIQSPSLAGVITVSRQEPLLITADLQRLYFQASDQKSSGETDLTQWPALNISIGDFRYLGKSLGRVNLATKPIHEGIELSKLQIDSADYALFISGDSKKAATHTHTHVSGQVKSENFGTLLNNLNLSSALVDADGIVSFTAEWMGSLISPNLPSVQGVIDVNLKNGVIVNLSSKAQSGIGLTRLLNLFSLQGFPSVGRLSQKGLNFTVLKGNFKLQKGNATSQNVYLDGPVAKVLAKGRIGYVAKDFDIIMTVRPYVTSSLPTVAAFAGGPLVGAVSWLVNRAVISPLVSRAVQFEYQVTGPWQQPVVVQLQQTKQSKSRK